MKSSNLKNLKVFFKLLAIGKIKFMTLSLEKYLLRYIFYLDSVLRPVPRSSGRWEGRWQPQAIRDLLRYLSQ